MPDNALPWARALPLGSNARPFPSTQICLPSSIVACCVCVPVSARFDNGPHELGNSDTATQPCHGSPADAVAAFRSERLGVSESLHRDSPRSRVTVELAHLTAAPSVSPVRVPVCRHYHSGKLPTEG